MEQARKALLIPGRGYTAQAPLLAYTTELLTRAGFEVRAISWQPPAGLSLEESGDWVRDRVGPLIDGHTRLLVGKSLGSLAAPLAAEHDLPAIWLTPLLAHPDVDDALDRATTRFLLVGGTADPSWDGPAARRLTSDVVEIEDADHSLMVPGPLARSADALGRVCTAIEDFIR